MGIVVELQLKSQCKVHVLSYNVFIVNEDIKNENNFRPNNTDSQLIVILLKLFKWQKNGICNKWKYKWCFTKLV